MQNQINELQLTNSWSEMKREREEEEEEGRIYDERDQK